MIGIVGRIFFARLCMAVSTGGYGACCPAVGAYQQHAVQHRTSSAVMTTCTGSMYRIDQTAGTGSAAMTVTRGTRVRTRRRYAGVVLHRMVGVIRVSSMTLQTGAATAGVDRGIPASVRSDDQVAVGSGAAGIVAVGAVGLMHVGDHIGAVMTLCSNTTGGIGKAGVIGAAAVHKMAGEIGSVAVYTIPVEILGGRGAREQGSQGGRHGVGQGQGHLGAVVANITFGGVDNLHHFDGSGCIPYFAAALAGRLVGIRWVRAYLLVVTVTAGGCHAYRDIA